MKRFFLLPVLALTMIFANATSAIAQEKTVMVGGAAMYPSKNIVENAINSKDHTTLVAAVKAAGLVETLQGDGPFTVFAPTNAAFDMLPKGTVETLVKPENKEKLTGILTYHVVAGKMNAKDLKEKIKKGNGKAMLKTVQGEELTVMEKGGNIWVKDMKGNTAKVTIADVNQSNGVIHVIDHVLMP
ncbi:MAG: fasciclin domain-containing protein [Sphingobacteriales bacterium]|nr:MAG: fasciclin domain-containing protein [Sphingobacteriales bacterium]